MARKKKRIKIEQPREEETVLKDPPAGDDVEAGQAGDLQGLSGMPGADSESVRELLEEGQFYEAGIVDAVENAPSADAGPVKTKQAPEDDVPLEYIEQDRDEPTE